MRVVVLRLCTKFDVHNFIGHPVIPFERYCALPVSALVGLVTLTFDLRP